MDPEVMHELERLEELRKRLEKRVEELGERVDRLEMGRVKVEYPKSFAGHSLGDGGKMNDYGLAQAKECMAGVAMRWSVTERLEAEKRTLEDRLAQVNKALDVLKANPQFQDLFDLISKTL